MVKQEAFSVLLICSKLDCRVYVVDDHGVIFLAIDLVRRNWAHCVGNNVIEQLLRKKKDAGIRRRIDDGAQMLNCGSKRQRWIR